MTVEIACVFDETAPAFFTFRCLTLDLMVKTESIPKQFTTSEALIYGIRFQQDFKPGRMPIG